MENYSLFLLICFGCFLQLFCKGQESIPSTSMTRAAYCACLCCEKDEGKCYKHPGISKRFYCDPDKCTAEFCNQWQQAKCSSSCYCSKCKSKFPPNSQRCILYDGVPPGCQCGDLEDVNCQVQPEDDKDVAEAMDKFRKMKSQSHCMIPCLCTKCLNKLPPHLQKDCQKSKSPHKDCSCDDSKCPSDEDLEVFNRLHKENLNVSETAKRLLQEAKLKTGSPELDEINKKLKPAIKSGRVEPVTTEKLKETKCKLQCFCDQCRSGNLELESNCRKMMKSREDNCPPCFDDIICPQADSEDLCKLFCFCSKCREDDRMVSRMKDKCDVILPHKHEACSCDDIINCDVLTQINMVGKGKQEEKPFDIETFLQENINENKRISDEL